MEYVDDDISARYALCIFTAINMLNYADRYVFSSVKELIKDGLHLYDTEVSLPTTGMPVSYTHLTLPTKRIV